MKRIRLLAVAALASSAIVASAAPAQARCHPDFQVVCRVIVTICDAIDRPCAA
ncbi:MAG TPA: hypothetical protein VHJ76_00870 [Actinomycetota bacterium]|nr:hypothetical protein [Actinomycetota bacterium]